MKCWKITFTKENGTTWFYGTDTDFIVDAICKAYAWYTLINNEAIIDIKIETVIR